MQSTPSYTDLDRQSQALKAVIEHPKFQEIIAEIRKLPPIERLGAGFTRLTPEALTKAGIPIPEGLSMSGTATENATNTTATATENPSSDANFQVEFKWCFFPWAYGSPSPAAPQPKLFVPSVSISILLA